MEIRYILLVSYLAVQMFGYWLTFLNLRHLRQEGENVPEEFSGLVDRQLLRRTAAYTRVHTVFGIVESVFGSAVLLVFLYGGLLDSFSGWVASTRLPFFAQGTLFFLALICVNELLETPFSLYGTFRIENRYGFNTMTFGLWLADLVKSLALNTLLMGGMLAAAFLLVQASPGWWWLYVWGFLFLFSIFVMYIAPYVIEPLFNKFSPLEDEALAERLRSVLGRAGIQVSRIFSMDASRRSTHTNAYFTGIGRVKRIVLFDTLLKNLDADEIAAVLAHEAGHWKKRHVIRMIAFFELFSLCGMYLAWKILGSGLIDAVFPMRAPGFFAHLVLLGFASSIVMFFTTPVVSALSRKHEREADRYACDITGQPAALASALVKLSKDNLSNLSPHPLYAGWHYSHPPVVQRVREILARKVS